VPSAADTGVQAPPEGADWARARAAP